MCIDKYDFSSDMTSTNPPRKRKPRERRVMMTFRFKPLVVAYLEELSRATGKSKTRIVEEALLHE